MRLIIRALVAATIVFCAVPAILRADEADDEKLFHRVMGRLMKNEAFVREYPEKFAYPPKTFIKPKSAKELNAYASAHPAFGAEFDEKAGKIRPVVMITQGYMASVVKGDETALAIIMGHELAHLTKDHVSAGARKGETAVVMLSFGRDQEIEADLDGMRYAIAAGYPYKKGLSAAVKEMRAATKYSSFEGLSATHPSWEERLVFLDREQHKLWSAMSAFQNGYIFLELEQYQSAQQCFKAVTAEFPDCHEAWSNLGYARLMQYCDALDSDDVKRYGIGQIVTGGFYSRPDSLDAKVRGIDEKLWHEAVKSLEKSLKVKEDLVLPRASLGIAHLVHPEGKKVKAAQKWFTEALAKYSSDAELQRNPMSHAALLVNAGVADMAAGDDDGAKEKFKLAGAIAGKLRLTLSVRNMEDAILYNQALLQARSGDANAKTQAIKMFESYLALTSPDSTWWPLAFALYAKLGKDLEITVRARSSFLRKPAPTDLRVLTSVKVGKDVLTLSEPVQDIVGRLGADAGEAIPLYPDSKIVRWRFLDRGIDLLAKEKVLAIFLTSKKSPPLTLHQVGVGGDSRELKVGMNEELAKAILKDQFSEPGLRAVDDAKTKYHFYPRLGLGIRYANERVEEIAIAQLPRKMFGEK